MDEKTAEESKGMRRGLTSYGDPDFSLFLRKAFIKGAGFTDAALERPVIAIADTGSDYNPCHGNAPQLMEAVKRGVMLAGGLPMAFPTISVHESFSAPTSMYLRNLMSMDTEEMIRAQPMDAIVLIGGCDKTVPAQLMGAASANESLRSSWSPARCSPAAHRGERVGACTDCRRYWGRFRAGEIDAAEIATSTTGWCASVGTCSVMGTASTMACIAEALGMTVPGGASPPAVTADRIRIAELTGAQAVRCARPALHPTASSPRPRSRTPCVCCWPSAAPPTASCTSPRSPGRVGPRDRPGGARSHGPRDAGAARPQAVGRSLHGGLPQGGRHGRRCCANSGRCCASRR
jgi:dihydroxy-acid dehydratase